MAFNIGAWGAIFNPRDRVLLVKRDYGKRNWVLPGGSVESGESPMEAVSREVEEETSLIVELRRLSGIYYNPELDMLLAIRSFSYIYPSALGFLIVCSFYLSWALPDLPSFLLFDVCR